MRSAAPEARWCPHPIDTTVMGSFDRFDELPEMQQEAVFRGEPADLAGYDVVAGHFALPNLAAFDAEDTCVLLREPRSRLVSHYTFWRGWTEEQHAEWTPYDHSRYAVDLSWEGFITEPDLAAQVDNLALRLVLGRRPEIPPNAFIDPADLPGLVAEAIVELDRVGHVDVIERAAACWDDLATWLDVSLEVGRHNESNLGDSSDDWSAAVTPAGAAALHDRTVGDRALWDHVARRRGIDRPAPLADATWERQLMRLSTATLHGELERTRDALVHTRAAVEHLERSRAVRWTRALRSGASRLRPRRG
jgi:hypothetical protein